MTKKLLLMMVMLFGAITSWSQTLPTNITEAEALAIVKTHMQGQDVDYYSFKKTTNPLYWFIFVDCEPNKGWEHSCKMFSIMKKRTSGTQSYTVADYTMPPQGTYTHLEVKDRYGDVTSNRANVKAKQLSEKDLETAKRTYAIILSGGADLVSNGYRFWNDCSFVYQTLVKTYGIPKANIYPILSDGDDPAQDMNMGSYFTSQPLDLDFDGEKDIYLAATKNNIQQTLNTILAKIQQDDQLLFFVTDHGGKVPNSTSSLIWLWNGETLEDYTLASMLRPFTEKMVNVNVVMAQCYSGGFIDDLSQAGCVVATACNGSEPSLAFTDFGFDEFIYHWTCAINGATHKYGSVNADADNDGHVSMLEAFNYAKANDRFANGYYPYCTEHPQYNSTPSSLGEELAIDRTVASVDLFIRDNPEDTGLEPNTTTTEFWKSPSIWVRNQNDGGTEHENPVYTEDHLISYVNVKIENRGTHDFNGQNKWVMVYWAQASTGLEAKTWKGRETYNGQYPTGGVLQATPIPAIPAGGSTTLSIKWLLPDLLCNYPEGNFHFCLLAKIMDTPYDDGYVDGYPYFTIQGSNDQAQKNVDIIKKAQLSKAFNVYMRSVDKVTTNYTLELKPETEADAEFFNRGDVQITLSPLIFSAWKPSGTLSDGVSLLSTNSTDEDQRTFTFTSPSAAIQQLQLAPGVFDIVKVKFNYTAAPLERKKYAFDLIQKTENGEIVGGETFIVDSSPITSIPLPITSTSEPECTILSVDEEGYSDIRWMDSNDNRIGKGQSIAVTPKVGNTTFSAVALTDEGDTAVGSITVEAFVAIESACVEGGYLNVSLKKGAPENALVTLASTLDNTLAASAQFQPDEKELQLPVNDLREGLYVLTLMVNEEPMDFVKVVIK